VVSARAKVRPFEVLRLVVAIVLFCAAPTAGDIGSCNQPDQALDPKPFFAEKKVIDCEQCQACGLVFTKACKAACSKNPPSPDTFPDDCLPLVHDGEVCIDALEAASCASYSHFVADQGATTPSECDFCPVMP
jgi:hypothetical protein